MITAQEAFTRLKDGNERYARGRSEGTICSRECAQIMTDPHPVAVVVGCSDSRVPTEIIFDVAPGDIWVVRSAGHVLSEAGLASVRFGVQTWKIPLVVVVGHDDCLAVEAAMAPEPAEWLRPITDFISPGLVAGASETTDQPPSLSDAVDTHVRASASALRTYLKILPSTEAAPTILGGTYHIHTGEVRWLEWPGHRTIGSDLG